MSHFEFKVAKAETEEELESAVRAAGREGWYRTSPNRITGEVPVASTHYCVLSRVLGPEPHRGDGLAPIPSFFQAKESAYWRC